MKIKNNFIEFKNNDKQIKLHNLILNNYLNLFANQQAHKASEGYSKALSFCFIKFDTAIAFDENSIIKGSDFNITLASYIKPTVVFSTNGVNINYHYDYITQILHNGEHSYWKDYNGRQIMTIGFATVTNDDFSNAIIKSIVDVSNYSIFVSDYMSISRNDTITTDAIFKSNDVNTPVHLSEIGGYPFFEKQVFNDGDDTYIYNANTQGQIYSIGLSNDLDKIEDEIILSAADIEYEDYGIVKIKNPLFNGYGGGTYCGDNLASTFIFSEKQKFKYFVLKYKVVQEYFTAINTSYLRDTGQFYTLGFPVSFSGNAKLKIKYERG